MAWQYLLVFDVHFWTHQQQTGRLKSGHGQPKIALAYFLTDFFLLWLLKVLVLICNQFR